MFIFENISKHLLGTTYMPRNLLSNVHKKVKDGFRKKDTQML